MAQQQINILILGGNGFIGQHIIKQLCRKKNVTLSVFDIAKPNQVVSGVDYFIGNFSDKNALEKAIVRADTIIHLISTTNPTTSENNYANDIQDNLLPTISLLELMVTYRTKKIIYFSSGGTVYGNADVIPTPETQPLHPICSYGIVKACIEQYIQMFAKLHNLDYLIIRPSNIYGIRENNIGVNGIINTILHKIKNHETITIWGDGSIIRDYIHVNDVCDFVEKAITTNILGIYNLGSGKGISVLELIQLIQNITKKNPQILFDKKREIDVQTMILDCSKSKQDVDWQIIVSLEEGICNMWKQITNEE